MMSLDMILSLAGLLFAFLGLLSVVISQAVGSEQMNVPVLFCFFVMLACQSARLVCWRELDAIPPVMAGAFGEWLMGESRRHTHGSKGRR